MQVAKGRVIGIEYDVQIDGENGLEIAESGNVEYLHGTGLLVPAMEAKLEGIEEGTRLVFTLAAKDAYGEYDKSSVVSLPRSLFSTVELHMGARLAARTLKGAVYSLTVKAIHTDTVVVDLNHPLAGKALHFHVLVRSVREATETDRLFGKTRSVETV